MLFIVCGIVEITRFNNSRLLYKKKNKNPRLARNAIIAMITTQASLSSNLTKLTNGPTIFDFVILKAFKMDTYHKRTPKLLRLFDNHLSIVG